MKEINQGNTSEYAETKYEIGGLLLCSVLEVLTLVKTEHCQKLVRKLKKLKQIYPVENEEVNSGNTSKTEDVDEDVKREKRLKQLAKRLKDIEQRFENHTHSSGGLL